MGRARINALLNESEFWERPEPVTPCCALCGRLPKRGTTEHHLIPRCCHSNRWFKKRFDRSRMNQTVPLCRDCHSAIHRFIPNEKELGRDYHTLEKLLEHEQIRRFVGWVRKQK